MAQREIASGFIYPQSATATSGTTRYGKNIHKPFRVLKGVDIDITFYIKSENGNPVNLLNTEISCIVTKTIEGVLVLSKQLAIQDEISGIVTLRLTATETMSLAIGFYNLNLLVKSVSRSSPVYLDTTFGVNYYIEILDNFTNASPTVFETDIFYYSSDKLYTKQLPGSAQYPSSNGVSTFAFKFDDFTGSIGAEATLETSPKESDWFVIDLSPTTTNNGVTYNNYTGTDAYAIEGKFVWVRFVSKKIGGTIDKVWYSV